MKKIIECKNNAKKRVELIEVPGFPQLGVLREGLCSDCNIKPMLRQGSRTVSFADGEMTRCVPAMIVESLVARVAILKLIGASAEEIESIQARVRAGEQ